MVSRYHDNESPPSEKDFYLEQAYKDIPKVVSENKVVTDREIKVRLEGEAFPGRTGPFPWVTGYALGYLLRDKLLDICGYAGRRRIKGGVPSKFYVLYGTACSDVAEIIQHKRRVSADINNVLTGEAKASDHAEDVFLEAFEGKLGFVCLGRDVCEFRGKKASGVAGKQPPNVDFVLEWNGVLFGVDVKNWIRYEYETPEEVQVKLKVCRELCLVPFIVARYIDRDLTNHIIYDLGGLVYEYKQLILQPDMKSLAEEANVLLGFPTVSVNVLPGSMIERIENICKLYFARKA